MKKLLITLIATLGLTGATRAALLLDETFTYPDGSLITNSAFAWNAHSGTTGQTQVIFGRVELRAQNTVNLPTQTEDVNRLIPSGPYSDPTSLYASFVVNFSEAPINGTGYFAHFKDSGNGFRCRVFASTNGAAAGKVRLGIVNFGATTPTVLAQDLDLNSDYKVVVRYTTTLSETNSTLWVNPSSEADPIQVTATDTTANSYNGTYSFALRQANSIGILQVDDLKVGTQFADVSVIGGPPSIIGLVSTNIPANSNTGPMPFLVSDVETPATSLSVTATSGNPTLVPNNPANLALAGTDTNRTLTVTPATSQEGTAIIEVVVTDGSGFKATNSFTLTVGQPTISAIADQTVLVGSVKTVNFWVNDVETAPGSLTVTATSSDQSVLPDSNIGIINSGNTNRTLQLTNTLAGVTLVTVTVSDGTFNVPTAFTLTVSPDNGILLAEDFNYADGSIITNSSFLWQPNTGTTGQAQIVSGKLLLANNGSEDLYRWFTNAPYADTSGQIIFTRYVVNFTALPTASGSGQYFQHTYAFSGAYKARVFSTTNGAASGKYRLSISNGGSTPQTFPQDLSLNQSYVVITRYNTGNSESTLWVNPTSSSSTSVTGIDSTSTTTTYGISFRQSTGIGSMSIDDLLVGSTFNQVLLVLPSSNADLSNLTISAGTLSPAFAAGTVGYSATVPNGTASITVTPTAADVGSTIEVRVNGGAYASVTSGAPSGALALNVGTNTLDVKVTATDTTTIKTYSVEVVRAAAAPSPEPITVTISGGEMVLSWTQGGWLLATGTNVLEVTNVISGATSPYTNSLTDPQRYFRLVYP